MNLSRLKIGQRLYLGFALVIALLVVVVSIGVSRLAHLGQEVDLTFNDRYQKIYVLNELIKDVNFQARNLRNILLMTEESDIKKEISRINEKTTQVSKDFEELGKNIRHPVGIDLFKAAIDARAQYHHYVTRWCNWLLPVKKTKHANYCSSNYVLINWHIWRRWIS